VAEKGSSPKPKRKLGHRGGFKEQITHLKRYMGKERLKTGEKKGESI